MMSFYYCSRAIAFLLFLPITSTIFGQTKIKLYIMYTPSHEQMMRDYFLPSIQDDLEVIKVFYDQECRHGNYMERGWNRTMLHKVELVIRAIKENWGTFFIHSDVDIQFFRPILPAILEAIRGKDIVCQQEKPIGGLCAGFFACRANEKTLKLWNDIHTNLSSAMGSTNDQTLLNDFLVSSHALSCQKNKYNIEWGYLPKTFMGGGITGVSWITGKQPAIPEDIIMYHANYCTGVASKIKQLAYVKNIVDGCKAE